MTATPAGIKQKPIAIFGLNEEELSLLEDFYDNPQCSRIFSPDAVDYLRRRRLIHSCSRGRMLAISLAGKGTVEAIRLLC